MAAAQHFNVAAKNYTGFTFIAGQQEMKHGDVYDKSNIKSGTTTTNVFYTRGDRDAAAGTEGKLVYTAEGHSDTKIIFDWDIPWGIGPDFLNVTVTGPIKIAGRSSFRGDEVVRKIVEIEIRDDEPLL